MAAPPPPPAGGMSLYANLLDPDPSATISRAPVLFRQPGEGGEGKDDSAAKKALDPALRFQPIRRPQQTKPKPKTAFPKAIPPSNFSATATAPPITSDAPVVTVAAATAAQPSRSTLADWAATEEDEYLYGTGEKRQRGGRRQKKKKKLEERPAETDWDDVYDPARPTNVEEYLRSDERIREIREWKALLYAHRRRKGVGRSQSHESESDEEKPVMGMGNQFGPPNEFAPPASYGFAPPPPSPPRLDSPPGPPPPDDATGEDAYARRLAMSGMAAPSTASHSPPPPPPPPPPDTDTSTISRAPVRYEAPPKAEDMDVDAEEHWPPPADDSSAELPARTSRPGQAGFAARLMSKYGWTKGSGLGADETGIAKPLRVQVEKRKKRSDADGGGYAEPGGRGKIIGGKRKEMPDDGGGFGAMSNVVVLRGMLEGMPDLAAEIEDGLGQEIGEECGEKYGRVERLYIDMEDRQVFIKFTDQVSGLRAVNALEGRIFNGNAIVAKFYGSEKFENGVYR